MRASTIHHPQAAVRTIRAAATSLMTSTIAWFRRDLRLADNRMLEAAARGANRVWPVFVADPGLLRRHATAAARIAWFARSLQALDDRLRSLGSELQILYGDPADQLRAFAATVGADHVVAAADDDPLAVVRDNTVAREVDLHLVDDLRILPAGALRTATGGPYQVFGPFHRAFAARLEADPGLLASAGPVPSGRFAPRARDGSGTDGFPSPQSPHSLPMPGERAAADRLASFIQHRIGTYDVLRDRPSAGGTSQLSPDLRVGSISIRAPWRAALEIEQREGEDRVRGARRWRAELAWREFLAQRPESNASDPAMAAEDRAEPLLEAWRAGCTGIPFVDAGMRQLVATGWMHNRARLVAASFLVKDAGLDWRRGAAVFREHLIDADDVQNDGNWRWIAGVGAGSAPPFRVFNPIRQGKRFDADGSYVRGWIPELTDMPDRYVHEPWLAPVPPRTYPAPLIDHALARERYLASSMRHRS